MNWTPSPASGMEESGRTRRLSSYWAFVFMGIGVCIVSGIIGMSFAFLQTGMEQWEEASGSARLSNVASTQRSGKGSGSDSAGMVLMEAIVSRYDAREQ